MPELMDQSRPVLASLCRLIYERERSVPANAVEVRREIQSLLSVAKQRAEGDGTKEFTADPRAGHDRLLARRTLSHLIDQVCAGGGGEAAPHGIFERDWDRPFSTNDYQDGGYLTLFFTQLDLLLERGPTRQDEDRLLLFYEALCLGMRGYKTRDDILQYLSRLESQELADVISPAPTREICPDAAKRVMDRKWAPPIDGWRWVPPAAVFLAVLVVALLAATKFSHQAALKQLDSALTAITASPARPSTRGDGPAGRGDGSKETPP